MKNQKNDIVYSVHFYFGIKIIAIFSSLIILISCFGQPTYSQNLQDPYDPATPSKDILDNLCEVKAVGLKKVHKTHVDEEDQYYLNDKRFTGWACDTDETNNHKFRYTKYISGSLKRQIGYYVGGQLDHDFHIQDGKSMGKERMWMDDGHLYIDHSYSSPGVMHGLQRRWHQNHVLARKAFFDNGKLIYEELFDQDGNSISLKGQKPVQ